MSGPYTAEQWQRLLSALVEIPGVDLDTADNRNEAFARLLQTAKMHIAVSAWPASPTGAVYRDMMSDLARQASELRESLSAVWMAAPLMHSADEGMTRRWGELTAGLEELARDGERLSKAGTAKHPVDQPRDRVFDWMLLDWLEAHFGIRGTVSNPTREGENARSNVAAFMKAASEPIYGQRDDGTILRNIRMRRERGFTSVPVEASRGRTKTLMPRSE